MLSKLKAEEKDRKRFWGNYELRLARCSDYDEVMRISRGLFGGLDIIPSVYHEYLNDPFRMFGVAVDTTTNQVVNTLLKTRECTCKVHCMYAA